MAIVFSYPVKQYALTQVSSHYWGAGGNFKLMKVSLTPTGNMVPSDFTEADFPGYAPIAASFWAPGTVYENSAQDAEQDGTAITFTCSGTTSQNIYGWYLVDSTGLVVLMAEKFAAPISLTTTGQTITLNPVVICKTC